jgi:hypothetical protein
VQDDAEQGRLSLLLCMHTREAAGTASGYKPLDGHGLTALLEIIGSDEVRFQATLFASSDSFVAQHRRARDGEGRLLDIAPSHAASQ